MALLRKELRALRPFLWLMLAIAALDGLGTLATRYPDQHTLSDIFDDFDASFAYLMLFAFAFAIGQTLIGRERGEETLEFLDALPVSRARVYWTKWLAGYLILTVHLLSVLLVHLPMHWWSLTSDDPGTYPEFWFAMLVMDQLVIAIYLSIAMVLAFWGRFGLLACLFYLVGVWMAKESGLPGMDRFDPLIYGQLNVIGSALIVPWDILRTQLAASIILAFLGQLAFERLGRQPEEVSGWKRAATPLFVVGLVLTAGAWIVTGVITSWDEAMATDPDAEPEPAYLDWETTRHRTEHFVFIYPNNQSRAAEDLAAEADAIHDRVTGFLGAEPRRELVVDLTSDSPRHAGVAYWGRIRMNLNARGLEARLPAVLGHELCHIYIDQLSGNKVSENFDATRFFHEGLASLVEYRFFRPEDELQQIRRVAAAAHDRETVRFEDLISSGRLSGKYASEWVYPLGEVFAAAVVETWGEDAPAALIRAFGRPDAPRGLGAMTLWQDTFQAAGYDLETTIGAFFRLLDETVAREREWLDSLPRFSGQLLRRPDEIGVRVVTEENTLPSGRRIFVRFRAGSGVPESEYRVRRPDEKGVAWLPRDFFSAGAVDFQIAHNPEAELMMPLFDPWVSARVR